MTYEERVDAVAKALMNEAGGWWGDNPQMTTEALEARKLWRARARVALAAIGIEPPKPKWPTDESVRAGDSGLEPEATRQYLRAAFLADPIIKAAIALRDSQRDEPRFRNTHAVIDAVNEAGL